MNEEEVKEYLFKQFLKWLEGQTVGVNTDGTIDYYEYDVERYAR